MQKTDQQQEIYDYLDRLPECTKNIPEEMNMSREKFIEIVKNYIDEKSGKNGFVVEFNESYTKIKKFDYILTATL